MNPLGDVERLDWLQLIRTETVGPITFRRLLARYGSARAALDALPALSRKAGRKAALKLAARGEIEDEIACAEQIGARFIAAGEADYPEPLAALPDRPPVITVRGRISLFDKAAIAVIGARNASGVGRKLARTFATGLGEAGVVVVSGLARGIDGAAHAAALETGTIAVVAGGVDAVYPPEHASLMEAIAERGLIVSERPIGHQPTARDFPRRNRLISGLSRGILVVEAAAKSGTLITARFALEQGREVFAAPGSPLDPRCQGANRLIRDGAVLAQTADDILDVLAAQTRGAGEDGRARPFDWNAAETDSAGEPDESALADLRAQVLELLGYTPLHRDELFREIDAPAGYLADALLDLVLSGEAEEHPGGRFSRAAG
ncbi:MAG: DNA-processing protein DprA [Parvularculaceae bacterium]